MTAALMCPVCRAMIIVALESTVVQSPGGAAVLEIGLEVQHADRHEVRVSSGRNRVRVRVAPSSCPKRVEA